MEIDIIIRNIKKLELLKEDISYLSNKILEANNVFIYGVGRSGYIGRCFHLRLLNLNINSYFLSDAPAFKKGDLLILISGSGKTDSVVIAYEKAKKIGEVVGIVCYPGKLKNLDYIIKIPIEKSQYLPMGTAFEQMALIFLDLVVAELMKKLKLKEEDIINNHNNLL
ncbi:SIS domain-containing protein [Methanocaldococcus sp.]